MNSGIYVALTLTIVNTTGSGYLSVYPANLTVRPDISSINWSVSNQVSATGLMTRTEVRNSTEEPARESFVKVYCGGGSTVARMPTTMNAGMTPTCTAVDESPDHPVAGNDQILHRGRHVRQRCEKGRPELPVALASVGDERVVVDVMAGASRLAVL